MSFKVNFLRTRNRLFSSNNCINEVYYTGILHIHAAVYAGFFYFHF
ncbi:hypothetical protein HMPREF2531_01924 [Bacteroides intestinalis]|uniref:Uncharacterized protein n=2 Tax=Bacteroides TaxID=816 RepID=A0A139LJN7_9BACE|nr:hypothetical protein BACCELL_02220 [Bacteroides cellulosilyticus DSM 14838]KXT51671.1 hypothetical protein HMPREF2531_01924 [Bacteroides intestinalis]